MADEEKAPEKPEKPEKSEKPAKPAKKDEAASAKKKGGPLNMILMIGGGLVVITGISAAVIFLVLVPNLKKASHAVKKVEVSQAKLGPVFEVKDLVINSADTDELHYFKVGVAMEVTTPTQLEELTRRDPQIRDLLITEFSQHTLRELSSMEGREAIRQGLLKKLNVRFGEAMLKSVYFTQYVAQ